MIFLVNKYILMISETKLDDSFPDDQFLTEGYHAPFRFDRNKYGGGIILYFREYTPAKILCHDFPVAASFLSKLICIKGSGFLTVHTIHTVILSNIWN